MYNLHSHSLLSDGVLLPSEIAIRYLDKGYKAIAITDHVDYSTIDSTIAAMLSFTRHWPRNAPIRVLSGIELTHLPLEQFKPLARRARSRGIQVIVAHGESPVEPVLAGTNRAALEADIDILAHPGRITDTDIRLAKKKGIFLELTSRRGHCAGNAFVAKQARALGAPLILNNDSHAPEDIISPRELYKVGLKAGLTQKELRSLETQVARFLREKGETR